MNLLKFACVAVLAATLAVPATAAAPALTVSGENLYDGDGPWTLGWTFTTAGPLTISALGAYDFGGDGFQQSHDVGIWTTSGTLLATATVSSGNTLIGGFRYTSLASNLTLAAGTYVVGAADMGVGDSYSFDGIVTMLDGITYGESRYGFGGGLALPVGHVDRLGYFGGNFLVGNSVPEPATWALMIGGFVMVGAAARRRRGTVAA